MNSELECKWWALRYKFSKTWKTKHISQGLADIRMSNYTQLLVACFTHLYNVRQQKGTYHGK